MLLGPNPQFSRAIVSFSWRAVSENHICVNLWLHPVKSHCDLSGAHLLCKHKFTALRVLILTLKSSELIAAEDNILCLDS